MDENSGRNAGKYAAFLLGVNIGPHKRVPMKDLRDMFECMGFGNVRTLLASGNVLFDSPGKNAAALAGELEEQLKKTFGFEVGVIVRPIADIKKMIDADPFKKVRVTKDVRLYVTFYTGEPQKKIALPYKAEDEEGGVFRIVNVSGNVVYSVVTLGESGTTEAMNILKKLFGRKITTRNWNTVKKLGA